MSNSHTIKEINIDRMSPKAVMRLQIDIQKTLEPYWRNATLIISHATPIYIVNPQTMSIKVSYPRPILKVLALIRSNARELIYAKYGIKLHKNYTL